MYHLLKFKGLSFRISIKFIFVSILFHSYKLNILSVFSFACVTLEILANHFINVATYLIEETTIAFFFLCLNHL